MVTTNRDPIQTVTGQLADKPARDQSSRGLDNSRTGQPAEIFDLKFKVYNNSVLFQTDCTIYTLSIFDRFSVRVRVRFNVQIEYSNSTIFKNSLSAS